MLGVKQWKKICIIIVFALPVFISGCADQMSNDQMISTNISAIMETPQSPLEVFRETPAPSHVVFPSSYDEILAGFDEDVVESLTPNKQPYFRVDDLLAIEVTPGVRIGCRPQEVIDALGNPQEIYEAHESMTYYYPESRFSFAVDYDGLQFLYGYQIEGTMLSSIDGMHYGTRPDEVFSQYAVDVLDDQAVARMHSGSLDLYIATIEKTSIERTVTSNNYAQSGYLAKYFDGEYGIRYIDSFETISTSLSNRLPEYLTSYAFWKTNNGCIFSFEAWIEEVNPFVIPFAEREYSTITPEIEAIAIANQKNAFARSDMVAGSVKYRDAMEYVEMELGKPDKVRAESDSLRCIDYWIYEYENGDIYIFEDNGLDSAFTLHSVDIISSETTGPRNIRVGDSMDDAISKFMVSPPCDMLDENEKDKYFTYFTDSVMLYARLYPYGVNEQGETVPSNEGIDTRYMPIAPYGMIQPMVITDNTAARYMLYYSFPMYDYDKEIIETFDMSYTTHGIMYIYCEDGFVTGISWLTYAAE